MKEISALGLVLRHFRDEKKLSQEDVAEAVGISRSHLSRIECGIKCPSILMLLKISGVLGVKASAIFIAIENQSLLEKVDEL